MSSATWCDLCKTTIEASGHYRLQVTVMDKHYKRTILALDLCQTCAEPQQQHTEEYGISFKRVAKKIAKKYNANLKYQ